MTKNDLINAVVKSCNGDNVSKRLAGEIIDKTFSIISKAIKKRKKIFIPQIWNLYD